MSYRTRYSRILAIFLWVVCAVWLVFMFRDSSAILLQLPVIAWIALAAYAVFWMPCVRIDAESLTIENVTRSITIPYADLDETRTKYSFTAIDKSGRKFSAWAAPAGSAAHGLLVQHRDVRATTTRTIGEEDSRIGVSASAMPGSDSGNVARYVERARDEWLRTNADHLGGSLERTSVRYRWWLIVGGGALSLVTLAIVFLAITT